MASSLGGVILERVIDADSQTPQDADGWPKVSPEQSTQDARTPETLERAPQHSSRFHGRELDSLDWYTTASRTGDRRLAVRANVGDPAGLAVGRLHEAATVEVEHAERYRSKLAGPPTAHREENVGGSGR